MLESWKGSASIVNLVLPTPGAPSNVLPKISSKPPPGSCTSVPIFNFVVLINSGASFSIAIILYLASSVIKEEESGPFFNIKKVSISILFLSVDGKAIHIFPSSAS